MRGACGQSAWRLALSLGGNEPTSVITLQRETLGLISGLEAKWPLGMTIAL